MSREKDDSSNGTVSNPSTLRRADDSHHKITIEHNIIQDSLTTQKQRESRKEQIQNTSKTQDG